MSHTHCDDLIHMSDLPLCARYFLLVHRLPAMDGTIITAYHGSPVCYANYQGKRVRLTMASRFGDVGITDDLKADRGYKWRVPMGELSDFSDEG